MRLLWVNHRDPEHPDAGGAEVHLREVGKRLVRLGHEVTLISERFNGSAYEDVVNGIKVKRVGNKYTIHLMVPLFVARQAKKFDIVIDDIAHGIPWWSPSVTDVPTLGIVHHVHQLVAPVELGFPLNAIVVAAEKTTKYAYKRILTVSKSTKEDLTSLLGIPENKIQVIYYGVDHNFYTPSTDKFEKPTILWLGRIKRYKNLDHLIYAFSILKKRLPDARLVIAGSGDYEGKIRELVSAHGLKGVTFTGRVWGERKLELLRRSWLLAMTSMIEGWGMSILEAAACMTPAIAYRSGAFEEAIIDGKTGLLAEYGQVNDLAMMMTEVLENNSLRNDLGKQALAYSHNFDWNRTTSETLLTIEQVLKISA